MLTSPGGYPHFIVTAGAIDPTSALWYSGIEDPRIQSLIKLYQNSKAVEDQARKSFASSDKLYIFA